MMSYMAFKSLRFKDGELYSPSYEARWDEVYDPVLGRLVYSLRTTPKALDGNGGIHAATLEKALGYLLGDCRLFLVAPHPDAEVILGTHGWRATHAIVVSECNALDEAARLILASHQAGYPQVEAILEWAQQFVRLLDGVRDVCVHAGADVRDLLEKHIALRRLIRAAVWGQEIRERPGKTAKVTWSTPIVVVGGYGPPKLIGKHWGVRGSCIAVSKHWLEKLLGKETRHEELPGIQVA